METMNIQELEKQINEANEAYRNGEEIITDDQFDKLVVELNTIDPTNELLSKIGGESVDGDRKIKLPIPMMSMNKIKTEEDILKWFKSKDLSGDMEFVLTPKYDGISLVTEEARKSAATRGDGEFGQKSDEHFSKMNTNNMDTDVVTFGEAIMPRQVFIDKYLPLGWSNARNLVGGKFNDKIPKDEVLDIDFIRYGLVGIDFDTKKEQLDYLNKHQQHQVKYSVVKGSELTEELLVGLYKEWCVVYEIDGIIIEVNDTEIKNKLGRERNGNPSGGRAYKSSVFDPVFESNVLGITYHTSKNGLLKPVINIEPVEIEGSVISNVTGNNAKFLKTINLGFGVGNRISLKKSGGVIPKLVEVISTTGFQLPIIEGVEIGWNENGVELIALTETDDQRLKELISFFAIMETEFLGEGIVAQFFDNGFDTVEKILTMTKGDMMKLDKFGEKKAQKIIDSINDKRTMTLSKVQHASNLFKNLGSKKLLLLEDLNENASIETIIGREGFSEISAKSYLDGIVKYNEWVKPLESLLNIVKTEKKEATGSGLEGKVFCFTGVRRPDLNELIESKGGTIGSGVSKKTTHLVCKDPNSGSSKLVKAEKLGAKIIGVEELETLLN